MPSTMRVRRLLDSPPAAPAVVESDCGFEMKTWGDASGKAIYTVRDVSKVVAEEAERKPREVL